MSSLLEPNTIMPIAASAAKTAGSFAIAGAIFGSLCHILGANEADDRDLGVSTKLIHQDNELMAQLWALKDMVSNNDRVARESFTQCVENMDELLQNYMVVAGGHTELRAWHSLKCHRLASDIEQQLQLIYDRYNGEMCEEEAQEIVGDIISSSQDMVNNLLIKD